MLVSGLTSFAFRVRLALLAGFLVFWLIPFFWVGRMGELPFTIPTRLLHQYACSGLFTKRTFNCIQPLVQIRHQSVNSWTTLDMAEFSPLSVFGYRPRVDRLLRKISGSKNRDDIRRRLAVWVTRRYEELHPEQGKVVELRFAQNLWPTNCPELTHPSGHWVANPTELGPNGKFQILVTYSINAGSAVLKPAVKSGIKLKTPSPKTPSVFARRPAVDTPASATKESSKPIKEVD